MEYLVKKASEFVIGLLTKSLPAEYTYHNLAHTLRVVDAVVEIGKNSSLSKDQLELLVLSAWFHDTGFVKGYKSHEDSSIELAVKFLKENNCSVDKITVITKNILVTELATKPDNILEKIMRDADSLHIGMADFYENSFSLKSEWEYVGKIKFTESEWIKSSLNFLIKTEFYTDYAKSKYESARQQNISRLRQMLN